MRFNVERNWIEVVGVIWMPAVTSAMRYNLSARDVNDIQSQSGKDLRAKVERWLALHAGDFQSITDFHAIVGEDEIPWKTEEGELAYADAMSPELD